jgi:hypothetical protein
MKSGPQGPSNLGRTTQGAPHTSGMWLPNRSNKAVRLAGLCGDTFGYPRHADEENAMSTSTLPITSHDLTEILDALTDWRSIVQRANRNGATRSEVLAGLRSSEVADRKMIARRVTRLKNCDPQILAVIAADAEKAIRILAARYTGTPNSILEDLASDDHLSVRSAVANNPTTSLRVLRLLSAHPDDTTRARVASRHLGTPEERIALAAATQSPGSHTDFGLPLTILNALAADPATSVRAAIAQRFLPSDISVRLANDADAEVAVTIGQSPWSPPSALQAIAKDPRPKVRSSLADNPATPLQLLEQLANDPCEEVRIHLASTTPHKVLLDQLAKGASLEIAIALIRNPRTPRKTLSILYSRRSEKFRRDIIDHPQIETPHLRPFLTVDDAQIRALARSRLQRKHGAVSSVSSYLLELALINGTSPRALHLNRVTTYRWLLDAEMPSAATLNAANDPKMPLGLRLDVLTYAHLPASVLIAAAKDPHRQIRAAAAAHPKLPEEVVEQLRADRTRIVRHALSVNPAIQQPSTTIPLGDRS